MIIPFEYDGSYVSDWTYSPFHAVLANTMATFDLEYVTLKVHASTIFLDCQVDANAERQILANSISAICEKREINNTCRVLFALDRYFVGRLDDPHFVVLDEGEYINQAEDTIYASNEMRPDGTIDLLTDYTPIGYAKQVADRHEIVIDGALVVV